MQRATWGTYFSHAGIVYSPSLIVEDDDPAVRKYPHLFERIGGEVERATARPGEKRTAKRAAPKKD